MPTRCANSARKLFGDAQQSAVFIPKAQIGVFDLFRRNIVICGGNFIVLLDDERLCLVEAFVDPLRRHAFACGLTSLGVPQLRINPHLATELRNRAVYGNAPHDRNFTVFLVLPLQVEEDFECTACHNSDLILQKYFR